MSATADASLAEELAPVARELQESAARRSAELRAAAEEKAVALMARSLEQAARTLEDARRAGASSARRVGAARGAESRRRAREAVLAARREAYESLRADVAARIDEQLDLPAGRDLRAYLCDLVAARAGAPAVEGREPGGRWRAVAESPSGRASVDVDTLVDQLLDRFGAEVEALWS